MWHGLSGADPDALEVIIIWDLRLPRLLAALLTGPALALAGLLLQSLFRNPIAGPDALGVSAGAGFGVAVFVFLAGTWGIRQAPVGAALVAAGVFGAFLVLLLVLVLARQARDLATVLLLGLLVGAGAGAGTTVLQHFASAEAIQRYAAWTAGSLGGMHYAELLCLVVILVPTVLMGFRLIRPLDALLLGESYARSLGVSVERTRLLLILLASLLTGAVTAFSGPIAFVGIITPHLARRWWRSGAHRHLLPGSLLLGAMLMLVCDAMTHLPGQSSGIPLNAATALIGIPVMVGMLTGKGLRSEQP
jgi:iron complex transport system permease protein